jgi:hypothetical protein
VSTPAIQPAGVTAAGTWSPTSDTLAHELPPALLADDLDPETGEIRTLFSAPHPADAAMEWNFRVKKSSGAAVRSAGHRFDRVENKGASEETELKHEANLVLQPFIAGRHIKVELMRVDTEGVGFDGSAMLIKYCNRHTSSVEELKP